MYNKRPLYLTYLPYPPTYSFFLTYLSYYLIYLSIYFVYTPTYLVYPTYLPYSPTLTIYVPTLLTYWLLESSRSQSTQYHVPITSHSQVIKCVNVSRDLRFIHYVSLRMSLPPLCPSIYFYCYVTLVIILPHS